MSLWAGAWKVGGVRQQSGMGKKVSMATLPAVTTNGTVTLKPISGILTRPDTYTKQRAETGGAWQYSRQKWPTCTLQASKQANVMRTMGCPPAENTLRCSWVADGSREPFCFSLRTAGKHSFWSDDVRLRQKWNIQPTFAVPGPRNFVLKFPDISKTAIISTELVVFDVNFVLF